MATCKTFTFCHERDDDVETMETMMIMTMVRPKVKKKTPRWQKERKLGNKRHLSSTGAIADHSSHHCLYYGIGKFHQIKFFIIIVFIVIIIMPIGHKHHFEWSFLLEWECTNPGAILTQVAPTAFLGHSALSAQNLSVHLTLFYIILHHLTLFYII